MRNFKFNRHIIAEQTTSNGDDNRIISIDEFDSLQSDRYVITRISCNITARFNGANVENKDFMLPNNQVGLIARFFNKQSQSIEVINGNSCFIPYSNESQTPQVRVYMCLPPVLQLNEGTTSTLYPYSISQFTAFLSFELSEYII